MGCMFCGRTDDDFIRRCNISSKIIDSIIFDFANPVGIEVEDRILV
jgi:hypothetical protein